MARTGAKQQRETQEERGRSTQQKSEGQGQASQSISNREQQQQQQTGLSRRHQQQSMPSMLSNPFGFMRRFGEGMEQLFNEVGFGGGLMSHGFDQMSRWTPQIEMFEANYTSERICRG